jgi:response regulator NasT
MLHGNIGTTPFRAPVAPMLRVLLVNDTDKPIAELEQALRDAGLEVLPHVAAATGLLKAVQEQQPDVVILDVDSPSRDTLEQLAMLHRHAPRPVVMFSADGNDGLIRDALGAGVAAYVVDGLSPARLAPVLRVAMARFEQQSHVRQRLDELEQKLGDRKDIDRAKALLMERRGMSEADAYAALRQQAMKQGLKLADVARRILSMADLLG